MLAMGWRGGLVVFLSVPVTFALTLLSYYLLDYTLNRITLFALVFVTGIVVDEFHYYCRKICTATLK